MLLTCSGRDSRRHADNLTRNIDNSGHSRPARTFTKSPKTAKVEMTDKALILEAATDVENGASRHHNSPLQRQHIRP